MSRDWIAMLEGRYKYDGSYLTPAEATMLSDYIENNVKDPAESKYLRGVLLENISPMGLTINPNDLVRFLHNLDDLTDA